MCGYVCIYACRIYSIGFHCMPLYFVFYYLLHCLSYKLHLQFLNLT